MIHRPLPGSPLPAHAPGDTIELVGGASYPFMRGVQSGTPAAPTVITYTGTARPIVAGIELGAKSHVVLRGLHVRGPGSGDGLSMIGPGENVTLDDLLLTDWYTCANINGHDGPRVGTTVRRCIFDRCATGLYYGKHYMNTLTEECWFRASDKFIYAGEDGDASNVVRNCWGIGNPNPKMTGGFVTRSGGLVEENVACGDEQSFCVGIKSWKGAKPPATLRRNVAIRGVGICKAFTLTGTDNVRLEDNIVAHAVGGDMVPRVLSLEADELLRGCTNTTETGTRISHWDDGRDNIDRMQALYVTGRYSQPPTLSGVQAHQPRGRGFAWFQEQS
jgi:hypothetical protein